MPPTLVADDERVVGVVEDLPGDGDGLLDPPQPAHRANVMCNTGHGHRQRA